MSNTRARQSWPALAVALLLLNLSLSFESLWPTPAITWTGQLSIECAVLLAALAAAWRWFGAPSRTALAGLAGLWTLLVLGRYLEVTSTALFGREINLYWDSRHLSAVAAMLGRATSPLVVLLVVATAVLVPVCAYLLVRWAVGRASAGMASPALRAAAAWYAVAVVLLFAGQRAFPEALTSPVLTAPVSQTWARQAVLVADVLTGRAARVLSEGPPIRSTLRAVPDTDILLVFLESYGAITFDQPAFARDLAASRARLEQDVRSSGLQAVSAFVQSPTFGGSSWLAHVSLLTGLEVRDEGTNVRLMTQQRPTLVSMLASHGYRTVAVMPGLQQAWPEGAFYDFDEIYSTERLHYTGPNFGWWPIPDQFAFAQLHRLELSRRPRGPVFAFLPTTSTHTPFSPTPPYQPSWARMLTDHPYEDADYQKAWAEPPDWLNLGPSYVRSIQYAYASVGGFLALPHERDFVMIVLGDHQPPAVVTGEGASWDVPVHVIASRATVLDALRARGFVDGITPARPTAMRMHELLPALLDAFGGPDPPLQISAADARPASRAGTARR